MTTYHYAYKFNADTLNCELDFQPAEPTTLYDPGCPATMELTSAKIKDIDIYDLLNPRLKHVIEVKALAAQLADLKDQADDARIEAYRDRTERNWEYA